MDPDVSEALRDATLHASLDEDALSIGIDAVNIDRIRAIAERSPRFLDRVFTSIEQDYCGLRADRLAARWAAKEAVRKLIGGKQLGEPLPPFRAIGVEHHANGAPFVTIHGLPQPYRLSLTHTGNEAIAVVVEQRPKEKLLTGLALDHACRIPARDPESDKGNFGCVVVIGGSWEYQGAPMLAALAAARSGAGLVRLCVPEAIVHRIASWGLEVMVAPLPDDHRGVLVPSSIDLIEERYLSRADVVVLGMGLGREKPTVDALRALFPKLAGFPVVVDADALVPFAAAAREPGGARCSAIITPHAGEMARIMGTDRERIGADREGWAVRAARELGAVAVLKGAHTVVADPEGRVGVLPYELPVLATGGTGDVLAGIIGSLVGQGIPLFEAAVTGVTLHAEAAAAYARAGGESGLLARDLIELLPRIQQAMRLSLQVR